MPEEVSQDPETDKTPDVDAEKAEEAAKEAERYGPEAYKKLQASHTKANQELKSYRDQLAAAGFTIGDDQTIYAPANWGVRGEEEGKPKEGEEEPDYDTRLTRLEEGLKSQRAVSEVTTLSLAASEKDNLLRQVAKDHREEAGKAFDAAIRSLPVEVRADRRMISTIKSKIVGDLVIREGAEAIATRSSRSETILGEMAGSAERPGGASQVTARGPSQDELKAYSLAGGQEGTGYTLEQYTAALDQRREARRG